MNFAFGSNWATRANLLYCRHRQSCRASVIYYAKSTCRSVCGWCGRDDNTDKLKLALLCFRLLSHWANISCWALSLLTSALCWVLFYRHARTYHCCRHRLMLSSSALCEGGTATVRNNNSVRVCEFGNMCVCVLACVQLCSACQTVPTVNV